MLDHDVIGEFRVTGVHSSGGLRAAHLRDGKRALVEIRAAADWRAEAVKLLRAISIINSVDHPGLARILGHGVLPDRRHWVASELATGLALSEIFARRRMTIQETIALVRDAAEVLAAAHDRGVVHGDLRAHKIIVACGTRQFPLQLGGWCDLRDGTDRDDIHALGALAYRAVAGRYPPALAPALLPGIPAVLSALIVGMLASDPAQRPRAIDVLAATQGLLEDRVRSRPARVRWTPALPMPTIEVAEIVELVDRRTRN